MTGSIFVWPMMMPAVSVEQLKDSLTQKRIEFDAMFEEKKKKLTSGDELPPGVQKMVKVYVAVKRRLQPGDKMAGRHGNKGVMSKIVPVEDMPYMADGTSGGHRAEPAGRAVAYERRPDSGNPSGLGCQGPGPENRPDAGSAGQAMVKEMRKFLEARSTTHRASRKISTGFSDDEVMELAATCRMACRSRRRYSTVRAKKKSRRMLKLAGLPEGGQVTLYDGRTGEAFERQVTVGYMHVLKLHHLVDDKMHARSTGPYSLVTQQPLGGKAQFGGQRFGEMEVWALEAYGASYVLQEMLTVKSDDVNGRTKVYENIVKGDHKIDAGMPESFNVLVKEIRSLGIDIDLERY